MAFGEGLDTESATTDDWSAAASSAMRVVISSLTNAPFAHAIDQIQTFRGQLDSLEALLGAQRSQAGHSDTSTEKITQRSGKVSKNEARKRTRRSNTVKKNPKLAKKLANGSLSSEKLDLLGEADEKTGNDGAAANDTELIDQLEGANPDQGKAIIRDYVDKHTTQDQRDSRYQKQRKARKVYKEQTRYGTTRLVIEGDDESVDQMLASCKDLADDFYKTDGGRDVPGHKHPRTFNQRLYDAANQLLTGQTTNDETGASNDVDQPHTAGAVSAPGNRSRPVRKPNRPKQRPTMVFTGNLGDITNDPELLAKWKAELIGTGTVPTAVRDYYACISDHAAVLLDQDGQPLWKGRSTRSVSHDQWIALIVRDGRCVQCDAHHTRCEAHHQTPWTAPAKGETNIDELVMLCVDCHHRLHELNHTIYRNTSGKMGHPARHLGGDTRQQPTQPQQPRANKRPPKSRARKGLDRDQTNSPASATTPCAQ